MTGHIYFGYEKGKKKFGVLKIGMTTQTIKAREAQIRKIEPTFKMLGYVTIENTHNCELLLVESVVRFKLWRKGYSHVGNDHFSYDIEKGTAHATIESIKEYALKVAQQTIDFLRSESD